MSKDRHVPAWLARRTYFKRLGRWVKPGKTHGNGPGPESAAALASNVVAFPVRADRLGRPDFADRRSIGIA
ncbi:hypothetical protein MKK88_30410 [Methylobacterium sp. E-005]|uniref:hypothetical protein n=1 Tax=Methylobacterium sp. E-005 TaxID=2836549 RepID=UPI001FBBC1FD|nr:hypothetical protein [Methylobacterium sp. E-005]MCJ2090267.1 hypothetical protein [Methylobacterium sp. E-005]